MSDTTTHLGLLDAMVQLSVLDRMRTAPPASPADGNRHLVASGATGLWAGQDLNIALWIDGAWIRLVPRTGWLVWVAAEGLVLVWSGSAWEVVGGPRDVSDAVFSLANDTDATRKATFSLAGIRAGTTRSVTLPNTLSDLAILAGTQTFTGNRTFSGTVAVSAARIGTASTTATCGMGPGGAMADSTNRLSVNAPAVLLNDAGAGIEATVSKAAAGAGRRAIAPIGVQRGTHASWQPAACRPGSSPRRRMEVSGAIPEQESTADLPATSHLRAPRLLVSDGATAAAVARRATRPPEQGGAS